MTVENENGHSVGSAVSPLAHFGAEVRLERERLGMSRAELGKSAHCGYSLVAKIEAGDRVPALEFAEVCDRVFPYSNGRFVRLWPLALRYAFPPWFRRYAELEWMATGLRMFHPQLVPGIAQTEEYARAVLRTGRPANLEDFVTARMERQRILERNKPTRLWLVLNEAVLRNVVGSEAVMHGQLAVLRDLAQKPPHTVQIVPSTGTNHRVASPFGMLSFSEGNDVVHVDGFPRGYLLADADDVSTANDAYDLLRAMAAPPDESADMIDTISKDCYS
ncbi:helix-turn-helix transcriptional regulator [Streptomyces sp. NBC_01306]|uniref:helix-turn-helix domain-containing protein n=1 Tax=Streptomyces sp. NBC_01306 TaxID=2903819 RepID=UPI002253DD8E|nr:helix-turn-helix transcriptional regulator [Streptomyces sp. NBC_01306]MCX4724925.1 helix-turn-helix transcriptional regulator [Streptomyces sp. NBC_01306]